MNDFINHEGNCSITSVGLFDDRLRQEDVISAQWERISPMNSLDGTRVMEFVVKGNDGFIDLHNCYIQLKVRVKKADDTNLDANAEIVVINYPVATLFEHVDVYLNNDLITNTSNYGYKAYLESLLTYSDTAKKGWLQAGGYFKDSHGQFDTLGNANGGFRFRKGLLAESKTMELIGKIHSDLFSQERFLLNHVDLKLVFTRHSDDFCLMVAAAEAVKIDIIDSWIMIRRSTLANHKMLEIESLLKKQDVKYYVPRVQVKTSTHAQGLQNIYIRNIVTGREIPNRIVVGLVSNATYNGSKAHNPFHFKHFNMTSADITVDSKSVYGKPLVMNMADGQYLQAYWSMMSSLGYNFRDDGCQLSRNEFDNGYYLICGDLTPTLCNGQYDDPIQSGNLVIDLKFSVALPETITVIVYMEFNNTISINSSRRAVKNFP